MIWIPNKRGQVSSQDVWVLIPEKPLSIVRKLVATAIARGCCSSSHSNSNNQQQHEATGTTRRSHRIRYGQPDLACVLCRQLWLWSPDGSIPCPFYFCFCNHQNWQKHSKRHRGRQSHTSNDKQGWPSHIHIPE